MAMTVETLEADGSGNLYGGTTAYGMGRGGTVYELTPSGGAWIFNLLYSLTGGQGEAPATHW